MVRGALKRRGNPYRGAMLRHRWRERQEARQRQRDDAIDRAMMMISQESEGPGDLAPGVVAG